MGGDRPPAAGARARRARSARRDAALGARPASATTDVTTTETPDAGAARRRKLIGLCAARDLFGLALLFRSASAPATSRVPSALIGRRCRRPCSRRSPVGTRRQAGTGLNPRGLHRRRQRPQCLGVLVHPLPHRSAAAAQARRRQAHPRGRHQLQADQPDNARRFLGRHGNPFVDGRRRSQSAARRSSGASTGCRRPSWSAATAASPTS